MQSDSAVVSITFSPRSIASRCVIRGRNSASELLPRVAVVHALDAVLRHQDRVGAHLERAQRGGGVGREERVAGAGREDHDAALLEVAHRAAPDVRLGHLGDRQRGHDARVGSLPLERVLQRERVEERREHPGVVGGRAVHPALGRGGEAAVEVAAADDDRDVDAVAADAGDLASRAPASRRDRSRTRARP